MELRKILTYYLLLPGLFFSNLAAQAANFDPKFDPRQSITYWLNAVVSADEDKHVLLADQIFTQLLRTWNKARLAPSLYVVKSKSGPWAASLEDGNILLSYEALLLTQTEKSQTTSNQLAFILAHEISHQKSDDLWQQKFFRMAGVQSPEHKSASIKNIPLQVEDVSDLERREAQADTDGLVLMSVAGFDPLSIVTDKNFFRQWAEAIWQSSCEEITENDDAYGACEQAKKRSSRAYIKLKDIAVKTTLFELGVQAFVLGDYAAARNYFITFGREYPYAVVHENIANSYLAEALVLKQYYSKEFEADKPKLYFPVLLAAEADIDKKKILELTKLGNTRSLSTVQREKKLKDKINKLLNHAVASFEHAMQINPNNAGTYLSLSLCYMLQENYFMAKGILQDKYKRLFATDDGFYYFIGLLSALQGKENNAKSTFLLIVNKSYDEIKSRFLPTELLIYAAYYNLSASEKKTDAKQIWKTLADKAKQENQPLLFQYAVSNIMSQDKVGINQNNTGFIHELNQLLKNINSDKNTSDELWLEGNRLRLQSSGNGIYTVVTEDKQIRAIWAQNMTSKSKQHLLMGETIERLYKSLGLPSRQVYTSRGKYLSYDNLNISFYLQQNQVVGWFLHK